MNKRILIFGLGQQGRKYADYFSSLGYYLFGINNSGKKVDFVSEQSTFGEVKEKDILFFQEFDYIIVAVYPYKNQNEVVEFLLSKHLMVTTLIEKPCVTDLDIFSQILEKDFMIPFVDEAIFGKYFQKKDIDSLKIYMRGGDYEVLEHALGFFLFREDFQNILDSMEIVDKDYGKYSDSLMYEIDFGKYSLQCDRGSYYVNSVSIGERIFHQSVDFFISHLQKDIVNLHTYKRNFSILESYIYATGGHTIT